MASLIKTKAFFEIILVVMSIFFISSLNVSAQQPSEQSCCEKTKSGESCVYTSSENCDRRFKSSNEECSESSFCETGCCFNDDGTCSNSASKSTCESKSGLFNKGISCSSIQLCNKGCCILGDNYFMATKQQCQEKSNLYKNLKMEFNPDITDEFTCISQLQNKERGCCVQESECIYTDRLSCTEGSMPPEQSLVQSPWQQSENSQQASATGNAVSPLVNQQNSQQSNQQQNYIGTIFETGKYCSQVPLCGCKAKHHKGCYDGDVYWYDSCNNREGIAQDCDFSNNNLCSKDTLKCESLDCKTTFDKKAINGNDIVGYDGVPRRNGESWCEYDGAVGFGQDLVGSRHYRHLCISGEEFIEPCKDFREEFCLQATGKLQTFNILEAACISNRWKDCATTCNTAKDKKTSAQIKLAMQYDRTCCEDPMKSCFWSAANNENIKKISGDAQKELSSACTDLNSNEPSCQPGDYQSSDPGNGVCIPIVPPGLKFWNDENIEQAKKTEQATADPVKTCETAKRTCTTYFYKNLLTGYDWKKVNTICLKKDFALSAMSYCKSLGDCGTKYNIAGKFSKLAFKCETSDGPCKGNKHGLSYNFINLDWEKEVGGLDAYTKAKPLQTKDFDLNGYKGMGSPDNPYGLANMLVTSIGGIAGTVISGVGLLMPVTTTATTTVAASMPAITLGGEGALAGISGTGGAASGAATSVSWVPLFGILIALVVAAFTLVLQLTAETDQIDITISCLPWQPPYGNKDCEKCTNKEIMEKLNFDTCSEYKCKSLSQNCKWIPENEGSNRTSCITTNINDVNSPKIKPWPEALTKGFKITEFQNGYQITPSPEGYALVSFGILTDEPATCKYALEPNIKYDSMPADFGDVFIDNKHMLTLSAIPNKLNEIYIKCKDANNIANEADYLIKFKARGGKDLTPPIILSSSIKNSAVISGTSTPLSLSINEPSRCRYSNKETTYEQMENPMVCSTDSAINSPSAKFTCSTNLKINEGTNIFYFKCSDLSNNINKESYILTLTGSPQLKITSTSPSGELDLNTITIEATTEGGSNDGIAKCSYTLSSKTYLFNQTDSTEHSTDLPQLSIGSYSIPISCKDSIGNSADATISFKVTRDITPPNLMFVYKQDNTLTISTDEPSACEYSNKDFAFGSGTLMDGQDKDHTLTIEKTKYSIICSDSFNNTGSLFTIYP